MAVSYSIPVAFSGVLPSTLFKSIPLVFLVLLLPGGLAEVSQVKKGDYLWNFVNVGSRLLS